MLHPQSFFFTGQVALCFLHLQSGIAFLHFEHVACGFSTGHAGPVTTGIGSAGAGVLHGQAAITVVKEHVDIPTAIAAAIDNFLIDIFTSLLLCFAFTRSKCSQNKHIPDFVRFMRFKTLVKFPIRQDDIYKLQM